MPDCPPAPAAPRPLAAGLGEALFDTFCPERQYLGGAPLNFAVHVHSLLQRAGGGAAMATRVGSDLLGERVLETLTARGIGTQAVQRDDKAPTGVVEVALDDAGHPTYDIRRDAAWDRFRFDDAWQELAAACGLVCYGTLAQRAETSRRAIAEFLHAADGAVKLCDLNLRAPFYNADVVRASLTAATVLKLNEGELPLAAKMLELPCGGELTEIAATVLEEFGLSAVVVTRGSAGTLAVTSEGPIDARPAPFDPQLGADAVGAGDACSAGVATGLLLGWPWERTLELANAAGAYVAERPGATPELAEAILARVG